LRARGSSRPLTKEARKKWRQEQDTIRILFEDIAPSYKERHGGYTRIIRLGFRDGDGAQMAMLEFIGSEFTPAKGAEKGGKKPKAEKAAAKKAETKKESSERGAEKAAGKPKAKKQGTRQLRLKQKSSAKTKGRGKEKPGEKKAGSKAKA
jgi:large subunit ribosomal protein L17